MSAGRLSYEPWTPNENKEETLRQEMWGTVMSWLKVKFGSAITEEDLDDRQLLLLRTAMRHEEDCRMCTDSKDCPHSGARYVVVVSEVNGYNRVSVAAEVCSNISAAKVQQGMVDLLENSLIPRPRRRNTFETYSTLNLPSSAKVAKAIALECAETGKSLILGGGVGTGKTHLAIAMANRYIGQGKPVLFLNLPAMMDKMRQETLRGENTTLQQAKNVDLLILDDAGVERVTEWRDEQLYDIVNHRYNHDLPLVITTNAVSMDSLRETLKGERSERICSRLAEMAEQAWLVGVEDYRTVAKAS